MKRLGIITLLFLLSCNQDKDINFDYELIEGDPGILVKNYTPVTRQELTKFLTKVNDTLKMKNFDVMLNAENIQQINPEFKGRFFRGSVGITELSYFNNDTAKLMNRLNFTIGTFEDEVFVKNDNWDSLLLNSRFLKSTD
jgi:hypothetical protein